jgi:ectoine hydroxylase
MKLTDVQIAEYQERGFLVFPNLVDPHEIEILRADLGRVAGLQAEEVTREKSGVVRTVFRVHDPKSPTASAPFEALARLPRILGPAQQLLRDDTLYVYHSKCNMKEAIKGEIWQWHQDYGAWRNDGVPTPNMTTALLMLDEASEIGGCLYFIPGSHTLGRFEAELDSAGRGRCHGALRRSGGDHRKARDRGAVSSEPSARVRTQDVALLALAHLHGLQSGREPAAGA